MIVCADAYYTVGRGVAIVVLAIIVLAILRLIIRAGVREGVAAAQDRATRQCPDCAELVLADAWVCQYCGYRFASRESLDVEEERQLAAVRDSVRREHPPRR